MAQEVTIAREPPGAVRDIEGARASFIERARALAPQLAARAAETTRLRRLPDENVAALRASGLTRVLQARRNGGDEAGLADHLETVAEIARGCGATGWCLGVYHAHHWLMGLFPTQAQDDVYGPWHDALLSAVLTPRGKANRTATGWRLSGAWPFCSGVHHADWAILGAMTESADGGCEEGLFLVPRDALSIKDDWHVAGLSGTGSNTVACADVEVPAHRYLPMAAAMEGDAPGAGGHATALYRSAIVPCLALFITSPAIGIAERALQSFTARLPGRVIAYTFDHKQIESAATHMAVAEAATKIDTARLVVHGMIREIALHAERGHSMPYARRAKARMDCAWAVRLCLEATERLVLSAGAGALSEHSELQLAARDLRAINVHGVLSLEPTQEMYGRALLGQPPSSPVV